MHVKMASGIWILLGLLNLFAVAPVNCAVRTNDTAATILTATHIAHRQTQTSFLNEIPLSNNNTDLNTTKSYATVLSSNPQCINGYGFKSLSSCRSACNESYEDPGFRNPINASAPIVYKLLVLRTEDYNRTDIQTIIQSKTTWLPLKTDHADGMMKICYPLRKTSIYCHKECYSGETFALTKNQQLIMLHDTYGFEDYHFLNRTDYCTGVVICEKSSSSFLIFSSCCVSIATLGLCAALMLNLLQEKRREFTGGVLLYHLMILTPGFILISSRTIYAARNSYYFPMDECLVVSSVQHLCVLIGCIGININLRQILRILEKDNKTTRVEITQQNHQAQIIARVTTLVLWFLFILITFEGDLLYFPEEFYPITTNSCWHRFSGHPLFICYACWMALAVLSTPVLGIYTVKKFIKWNNVKISTKKVCTKTSIHVLIMVVQVIIYWLILNFLLPWEMWYSLSAGVVDLWKAGLACFLFVSYMWDISKFSTTLRCLCKNGCRCFQPA